MRLIVHAGFHKTGTSSVQKMLRRNGNRFAREFRVFTHRDLPGLCGAARALSASRDPLDDGLFAMELAEFLTALDTDDPRPVVISSENLAGHMPGRYGLRHYSAAPAIMARFAEFAAECLAAPRITFYFSTRAPEAWLRSCHWQHLCATRMTDDFATYRAAYLPHADLAGDVAAIARAVPAPHDVVSAALDDASGGPLGPLDPLLDVMSPSDALRAALTALPPANTAQPAHVADELLRLNRSDMDADTVHAAKTALLQRGQSG
ncbi:MAG: hypothetical protein FH759_12235 [Sediminimonas qiaohouensis]|uniref:Sulfotransferase family protein n=1 Tax=Sediminimonas qiaohouensis TaxID=552061 RepID=A0A7C9HBP0_9RHOB|nr:hypothetical protein [Sediminimonas qiaohouensis]MTJ05446.1 hypothetical protein [Sediminimonas qiaohouensis]